MAGIINAGTLYDALWGLPDGQEVLLFSNDLREMSQVPMLSESWFAFQSLSQVSFEARACVPLCCISVLLSEVGGGV
jgi:hypothetical protein